MQNKTEILQKKESFLPRLSVRRPVTVLMILLALFVMGGVAFNKIPLDLFPRGFVPPFLGVWIPYPNSNPQEVEEQIARPVEEVIHTIPGVRDIRSNSSSNGCWVFIEFSQKTDMNLAYGNLRDRMDRVKPDLPNDIERIFVRKWSDDDDPILWIALISDEEIEDPYFFIEEKIQKPLERIDGVGNIEIWGAFEKDILIDIDDDLVKAHGVNLYQVIRDLRNDNFTMSSGWISEGGNKIYVRSLGRFHSLEELRNLPIGKNLRLKDIAKVRLDVPERDRIHRIDGKKAVSLGIYKESMANTVELSARIRTVFDRIKNSEEFRNSKMIILFDQGKYITESVNNLLYTMMWGGGFAFLILFAFLRRIRMTLMITIAIPLSIMITVMVIYFVGWSLNVMTLCGLMISIGLVVDNAIVIVENIFRNQAIFKDRKRASIIGASEVGLAITMATLTTVVVFLPLILMNDEVGFTFYLLRIGLPVMIALVSSLFVALIFIPLGVSRWGFRKDVNKVSASEGKTIRLYHRILNWTINHRVDALILFVIIPMILTVHACKNVKKTDEVDGNINDFRIIAELPDTYSLEKADKVFQYIERQLDSLKEDYHIKSVQTRFSSTFGRVRVFLEQPENLQWYSHGLEIIKHRLNPDKPYRMSRQEIIEDFKKRLPDIPGVEFRTSWRQDESGDGSVSFNIFGPDTKTLMSLGEEFKRRLKQLPEVVSVELGSEKGGNEIHIIVNREQARKYAISPIQVAQTVAYALRGVDLPDYRTESREIDIRIQLRKEDRKNLQQLKNFKLVAGNGTEVPLSALASFIITKGPGEIRRTNGKTNLEVKVFTNLDDMEKARRMILGVAGTVELPRGYEMGLGRRFQKLEESNQSQQQAIYLAITFVFLLMGVLFESFILPLSVIFSVPLSFFGAYWLLYITDTSFDLMAGIGLIILIGVVVNNAIVLIDMVNRYRLSGKNRYEAIMAASRNRFRPILMTAFTTIAGLIPMALGNATLVGIPYAPMGRTMIGGIFTSTFLTLVVVPLFYTIFDDFRVFMLSLFKKTVSSFRIERQETASNI